jgi:hypothetical protein
MEKQRKCKCILLSERSQSEQATYYRFQLFDILENSTEDSKNLIFPGVRGEGGMNRYST